MQEKRNEFFQSCDEFSRQLKQHRQAIFTHIFMLTGNRTVAEDIFQDTSLILFEKFSQYDAQKSFKAWAKQIALNVVLNYRRKKSNHLAFFSEGHFEQLATRSDEHERKQDRRGEALKDCVQKLRLRDRELIACRYGEKVITAKEVAKQLDRPIHTVYKSLQRIRNTLLSCIQKTLALEEQA